MKIHLYTVCWNEEKLAKHFVEHYSKFCEKIVVYDNGSTDNTIQKLSHPKVEVRKFETDGLRDDIHRDIKNTCWKESVGKSDYVIVCDFDEFLYHENLFEFLEKNKDFNVFHPDVFDMITEEDFDDEKDLLSFCNKGYLRDDGYNQKQNKCILFNPNKIKNIGYSEGAHKISNDREIKLYFNKNNYELKLLHYKYLTIKYVLNRKNILCQRLSKTNKQMKWGYQNCWEDNVWINRFYETKKNSVNVFEKK